MFRNLLLATLAHFLFFSNAVAGTLRLETSVVVVNADTGEGTLSIKNEDTIPLLLITKLENLPEDPESMLLVTPPVARIEPTNSQVVRFLLKKNTTLKTERMMRVSFESVAPKELGKVRIGINQNIPVIIRPLNLPQDDQPWKHLDWQLSGDQMTVTNPSPYVVRLAQTMQLVPAGTVILPRTYLLPGESLKISVPPKVKNSRSVKIEPASLYGYILPPYEMKIKSK